MTLLQQALHEALDGSIPKTSPLVTASHKAPEDLLVWIATEDNGVCAEHFTTSVIKLFDRAFQQTVPV